MSFLKYDGLGLAQLVKDRQVTPLELVDASINHIERVNPALNAVVSKSYDRAREQAQRVSLDGPFAGVPFLLKDLGAFEPHVTASHGSRFCKTFAPRIESEIVSRYKAAGFITLGRTNTPELGLLPTTEPKLNGPTRNPWNTDHSVGGSSGGAAAAVSSGMVPIAHGGDGGGSIRIPSSCCGVFGLKPSQGRSPVGPVGGRLWHGLVVEHVITKSVRDSAACLDVISVPQRGAPLHAPQPTRSFLTQLDEPLQPLRIGLIEEPYFKASVHDDCREAVNDAATLCSSLGHNVEPTRFQFQADKIAHAYTVIIAAETAATLDALGSAQGRKPRSSDLEALTDVCRLGGRALSAFDYATAVRIMDEARRDVAKTFANFDVVLTPTLALPPPRLGELDPPLGDKMLMEFLRLFPLKPLLRLAFREIPKKAFRFTPFAFLFNLTGQPAMSVPLFVNRNGLPIGTQFAADFGEDALLLRLAKQLESARPFTARMPDYQGLQKS